MKHPLMLAAAVCFLCAPSAALADQSRKGGISQLDFDQPPAREPGLTKEQLKEILDTKSNSQLPPAKVAAPDANGRLAKEDKTGKKDLSKGDRTARASLAQPNPPKIQNGIERFDWAKPDEGTSHYLTPKLRGPVVDAGSDNTISTKLAWKREGGSCADVNTSEQLIRKAQALKELLNRFSGSDEFFERQCGQTCSKENEAPALIGFGVHKVPEGDFKMTETNGTCQYLIRSNVTPPKWQMLEGERGSCACLPKQSL